MDPLGRRQGAHSEDSSWLSADSLPHRAERLVTLGRVGLLAAYLIALWLDPMPPVRYARLTNALLVASLAVAVAVAVDVRRRTVLPARLALLTHAADMAMCAALLYLSGGGTSPFFGYVVFTLLTATVRWNWQGTVWTGAATLVLFVAVGYLGSSASGEPALDVRLFLIRVVYVAMLVVFLALLAASERRVRGDLIRLLSWMPVVDDRASPIPAVLRHSADVLGAPRVVMAWGEREEPGHSVAAWDGGAFTSTSEAPTGSPLVPDPLAEAEFFCEDVGAAPSAVHWLRFAGRPWVGESVDPQLRSRFGMTAVISAPLRGPTVAGRIFWLDKRGVTVKDLVIARIAARQLVGQLELFLAQKRLRQTAATEERVRLARVLHDGVLQSLAEASLLLGRTRRQLVTDPRAAEAGLDELAHLLEARQGELRSLVQQLRPGGRTAFDEPAADLNARLRETADRLRRHWGVRVELGPNPLGGLRGLLARELYLLIHEALINVAKHASATTARVHVTRQTGCVRVVVTDNGKGFDFHGCYDHIMLADAGLGPVMLRERVKALRGHLELDSTPTGVRIEISIPLARSR